MTISKWQVTGLLFGLLFVGSVVAVESKYQQDTTAKQEEKLRQMEKKQQKKEEKQQKMEMKQKGMKQKVKSYGEVVLEKTEDLDLTNEQLGKIMRIQMTNKKTRKELIDQPHKSMKKALKELRNPSADEALIRKAGATHTADFDALIEAELKMRKKIDAVLTRKQKTKLKAMKPSPEDKTNESKSPG